VTEPVLYRIRRALPVYAGGIDFSPIVVFIGIMFLQSFLVQTLRQTRLPHAVTTRGVILQVRVVPRARRTR
jgi:hypothetical protein